MKVLYCDYRISPNAGHFVSGIQSYLPECEVECWAYTDDETFIRKLNGVDGLLTSNLKVSEHVILHAPDLKVISVDATGYGNISAEAAKKQGILVCSMGAYCTEEVADHALLLVLMLVKKIKQHLMNEEKGLYDYKLCEAPGRIAGKAFVIFGYGRVGRHVAARARVFGYHVYAVPHRPEKIGLTEEDVTFISRQEACEIADVIVNTMSETTETFEYFWKGFFDELKRSPVFVNVGRGSAVNETELLDALKSGQVSAAGLDVLKEVHPDLSQSPFMEMDNVILTPHMAFYSRESMESIRTLPVKNLVFGLLGETEQISNIAR